MENIPIEQQEQEQEQDPKPNHLEAGPESETTIRPSEFDPPKINPEKTAELAETILAQLQEFGAGVADFLDTLKNELAPAPKRKLFMALAIVMSFLAAPAISAEKPWAPSQTTEQSGNKPGESGNPGERSLNTMYTPIPGFGDPAGNYDRFFSKGLEEQLPIGGPRMDKQGPELVDLDQ
ncbi:MAG TPA: hypothetical protein PLK76_03960 [bacterium]|nr:hypothetical protein [bacterium]